MGMPTLHDQLPQISPGNPQGVLVAVEKVKLFGHVPVPSSHSGIFDPFGVGNGQLADEFGFECLGDIGKLQVL